MGIRQPPSGAAEGQRLKWHNLRRGCSTPNTHPSTRHIYAGIFRTVGMVLTGGTIVIRDRVIVGETFKQIAVPHHPDQ
jgi:hypothetical protein